MHDTQALCMCTSTNERSKDTNAERSDYPLLQKPLDKLRTEHVQMCPSLTPQVPIATACTSFLNLCIASESFRVSTLLIHALGNFLVPYAHECAQKAGSGTTLIEQRVEYINEYDTRNRLMEFLQAHEFSNLSTVQGHC